MKIKRFTLLSLATLAVVLSSFSWFGSKEAKYFPKRLEKSRVSSAQGFIEFMQSIKADQQTGTVDPDLVMAARKQVDVLPKGKSSLNLSWQFKGPDNIGGRTRALIIDRNNPDHLYAGGVAGGVFETFDGAVNWQPYDPDFKVNNISCMTQAIDGSVYVGTGGHFENPFNTTNRGYFFIGTGVHKLTGNGTYELVVGPTNRRDANIDYATIGEIEADPTDANVLHVAMNRGYRVLTFDPNSNSWSSASPISSSRRCNDIDISADGQTIVVSFVGEIHVSQDGGQTFTNTTPSGNFRRIECDIAPSDKNIVYAGATAAGSTCLSGVYRSRDGGLTWESILSGGGGGLFDPYANPGVNCQGNWDNMVEVAPDDPGKLTVGGVTLFRWEQSSVDPAPANGSWNRIDVLFDFTASGDLVPFYVHADKHNMVFDPRDSDVAYIATDGGITKTTNFNDAQPTYRVHNYKYGVTQYYGIDINANDVAMGGTQDNGSHLVGVEFNNNLGGIEVLGGDGFDAALSVIDPSIGVASSQFNVIRRIQGINPQIGASNISTANIVNSNRLLGGLCQTPEGCSNVFYNCLEMWESFNHEGSTDSVDIVEERKTLPPIAAGTRVEFDGNNNDAKQIAILENDLFPFDTVSATSERLIDYNVADLINSGNALVLNFDTVSIDLITKTLTVNKYGNTTLNIPFQYGVRDSYTNLFLDTINKRAGLTGSMAREVSFVVDSIDAQTQILRLENAEIVFRYRYAVQDKVQNILASANWPGVAANYNERNIFITRDLLKGQSDIVWHHVAGSRSTPDPITGTVIDMAFSSDGNHMFIGTTSGALFRVSDLDSVDTDLPHSASGNQIYDIVNGPLAGKCQQIGRFAGRSVTSIAIDPNNDDNLIVTLGNYGNHDHVARTTIATTAVDPTGTFEFIQGNGTTALPQAPAYSVMIDKDNPNNVLVGNELGVFSTDSAFAVDVNNVEWSEENVGLGRVPVFEIRQMVYDYADINATLLDTLESINNGNLVMNGQTVTDQNVIDSVRNHLSEGLVPVENEGVIYIGTHGRGIYKSDGLVSINELSREDETTTLKESLQLFPNPARNTANLKLNIKETKEPLRVQVYSIKGQLVRELSFNNLTRGENQFTLNVEDLVHGTYILRAIQADEMVSTKFIKQ